MRIPDVLERQAAHHGGEQAVTIGSEQVTFAQLWERSVALAAVLSEHVASSEVVTVLAENRSDLLELYYAAGIAGIVISPLNQRLHPRELARILDLADPALCLTSERYESTMREALARSTVSPELLELGAFASRSVPTGARDRVLARTGTDQDVFAIVFTSGSTGSPKAVPLTHRNQLTSMVGMRMHEGSGRVTTIVDDRIDSYLVAFPLCHVAGMGFVGAHLSARRVAVLDQFDPERFLATVEQERIGMAGLAPTMIQMLLEADPHGKTDASSLRRISYGASPMPPQLLRSAVERFGPVFVQHYGMTEAAGAICELTPADHRRALEERPSMLAAAGRSMLLADVRCVDAAGRNVAPGEVGEIVARGDQVADGYWRDPEATARSFRDGWFHTGDIARVDEEGLLYIVDRRAHKIVTGGENVYPREVEDVLVGHPGVADIAVIGLPDQRWGELVTAVVVPRTDSPPNLEELQDLSRRHLAGYKVPRRLEYATQLPRNASGKVLKRQLVDEHGPIAPVDHPRH